MQLCRLDYYSGDNFPQPDANFTSHCSKTLPQDVCESSHHQCSLKQAIAHIHFYFNARGPSFNGHKFTVTATTQLILHQQKQYFI